MDEIITYAILGSLPFVLLGVFILYFKLSGLDKSVSEIDRIINEADVYIAYGQKEKARKHLLKAQEKHIGEQAIALKLKEISNSNS